MSFRLNTELRARMVERLNDAGVSVADSGAKERPHKVLGESLDDYGLYMAANLLTAYAREQWDREQAQRQKLCGEANGMAPCGKPATLRALIVESGQHYPVCENCARNIDTKAGYQIIKLGRY